jgi:DNA-binding transcriptional ArsR family regulator
MTQQTDRLERLIADELGDCCAADVETRLETLEEYDAATPSPTEMDLDAVQTLGNETRYNIVQLLVTADSSLCVCELTHLIEVSDSAISHALSDLHDAGLVDREKDGQWRYYEPTDRAVELIAALDRTRK